MATRTISTKLAIDGEAEYKAAIKNINAELSLHKSELEKIQAKYKDSANSMEALSGKQSALKGQLEALTEKHAKQAEMLEKAQKAQQEYANQAENLRRKLDELQNSSSATAEEEAKLKDELAKAEENMQKAANSAIFYQKQLNNTERDQANLGTELEQTGKYLDEAANSADGCAKSIDEYGKEVKEAGGESEKAGKKFETVKSIVIELGAAAAEATAVLAAAVKAGSEVIGAYADYEQLVGGVETLFKDSSGQVLEYANNAYKTAGLSANEYMETVTGFSARLISSLGGDTAKAAQYADMAITDMSDNANKMIWLMRALI